MRWKVIGASLSTGKDVIAVLDANSVDECKSRATDLGIAWTSIEASPKSSGWSQFGTSTWGLAALYTILLAIAAFCCLVAFQTNRPDAKSTSQFFGDRAGLLGLIESHPTAGGAVEKYRDVENGVDIVVDERDGKVFGAKFKFISWSPKRFPFNASTNESMRNRFVEVMSTVLHSSGVCTDSESARKLAEKWAKKVDESPETSDGAGSSKTAYIAILSSEEANVEVIIGRSSEAVKTTLVP